MTMMQHNNIVECTKDESTLITTDKDSFIYTCPVCGNNRRFAIPEKEEFVFCNGEDMGTTNFVEVVEENISEETEWQD